MRQCKVRLRVRVFVSANARAVIYNPAAEDAFKGRLRLLQGRRGNAQFAPAPWGNNGAARDGVRAALAELGRPYMDVDAPNVTLLPLWHGTSGAKVGSVAGTGFANLATTDGGFFGKGIYGTLEPEYAYRVYAKGGPLILFWSAFFSAFPLVDDGRLAPHASGIQLKVVPARRHRACDSPHISRET